MSSPFIHLFHIIALMAIPLSCSWANQHSSVYFDEDIWSKPFFNNETLNGLSVNPKIVNSDDQLNSVRVLWGLTADELSAYSSFGLLIVTILLVIVGIFTACVLIRQTNEFKKSIDLSAEQFVAINRAWISFDVAFSEYYDSSHPSPIRFDGGGMKLSLKFTLRNVGKQPAFNVCPYYKIVLTQGHLKPEQDIFCDSIKYRWNKLGFTVFPGDPEKFFYLTCDLAQSEIKSDLSQKLERYEGNEELVTPHLLTVSVVGCINYRSTLDSDSIKYYQTRFAYHISATQADGGKMQLYGYLLPVQSEPIPVEHLNLSPATLDDVFSAD